MQIATRLLLYSTKDKTDSPLCLLVPGYTLLYNNTLTVLRMSFRSRLSHFKEKEIRTTVRTKITLL